MGVWKDRRLRARAIRRWLVGGFGVWLASLVLLADTVGQQSNAFRLVGGGGFAVGAVLLWSGAVWRMAHIGIYVNDRGVLVRYLLSSRSLTWDQVAGVHPDDPTAPAARQAGPGRVIWITPTAGAPFETSVVRKGSRDAGLRKRNRRMLSTPDFAAALSELRGYTPAPPQVAADRSNGFDDW